MLLNKTYLNLCKVIYSTVHVIMYSDYIPPGQRSCLIIKFMFIKIFHSSARHGLMLPYMLLLVCSSQLTNTEDHVMITNVRFDDSGLANIVGICFGTVIHDGRCASGHPGCFLYYLGVPIIIINSIEVFYMIRHIIVLINHLICG